MSHITRNEFMQLVKPVGSPCASVYLPTHHGGIEVLEGEDALVYRNQLKEIRERLKLLGLDQSRIERFMEPAEKRAKDGDFWRHQSAGLAIFFQEGFYREYVLPFSVDRFNCLSRSAFFLLPLLPALNGEMFFHVLQLELGSVRLFRCTQYDVEEIPIGEEVPQALTDEVGQDHWQKSIQVRNLKGGTSQGVFHGHGEGKDEEKTEIRKFFRSVDRGLLDVIGNQDLPLLVACDEYLFPIFREVSNHRKLHPHPIRRCAMDCDPADLRENALLALRDYTDREKEEKKRLYRQFHGTGRANNNIAEIIPAAVNGRVDSLFIQKGADAFGVFNPVEARVTVDENHPPNNISLYNLAAVSTFLGNGKIFLLEKGEMPDGFSTINALYRY